MKATELISHLVRVMNKTGRDVELNFVLDEVCWHPSINVSLRRLETDLPDKYGITFVLEDGGQNNSQSKDGYMFRHVAAFAWRKAQER